MALTNDDREDTVLIGDDGLAVTGAGSVKLGAAGIGVVETEGDTGLGGNGITGGVSQPALEGENTTGGFGTGGGGVGQLLTGFDDGLVVEAVAESGEEKNQAGNKKIAVEGEAKFWFQGKCWR